jgi:hypothetical protein
VNEDWLGRYRGWVYGVGFGAQLGVGVVTIVTSAAVYAAVFGVIVSGNAVTGAIAGAAFGLVRALSLLPARAAVDPPSLARLHASLARLGPWSTALVVISELVAIGLLVAAV